MRRLTAAVLGVAICTILWSGPPALAAGGGAQVAHRVPCLFEPGDVPGVDVFFPATCVIQVIAPSGQATVVARGLLPPGFNLSATFQGSVPCHFFDQTVTGHVVATTSRNVQAVCHFRNV